MIKDAFIVCPEHGDLVVQRGGKLFGRVDADFITPCQGWVPQPLNGETIHCPRCLRTAGWGVVPVKGYNLPEDWDGLYAEIRPRVMVI